MPCPVGGRPLLPVSRPRVCSAVGRPRVCSAACRQAALPTRLRTRKLPAIAEPFAAVALPAAKAGRTHAALLDELVRAAGARREERRVARLRHQSGLPAERTFRTLPLDRFPPGIRQQIARLRTGSFVAEAVTGVAAGTPGVGKRHLPQAGWSRSAMSWCWRAPAPRRRRSSTGGSRPASSGSPTTGPPAEAELAGRSRRSRQSKEGTAQAGSGAEFSPDPPGSTKEQRKEQSKEQRTTTTTALPAGLRHPGGAFPITQRGNRCGGRRPARLRRVVGGRSHGR